MPTPLTTSRRPRRADHLVNIWGADHAGTVKRVQAAVKALTDGRVDLDVKIIQMVGCCAPASRSRCPSAPAISSRWPKSSSEVGKDVVRFMMLTKRADTPLDFDFAKVVEASKDNPVFYVQYAHARIASLQRKAADAGVISLDRRRTSSLLDDEELALVKQAAQFPRTIEAAALAHEPHRIAFYLVRARGRSSTRCGTAATTIPRAASSLKIIHKYLARGWNWRAGSGRSSAAAWR